MADGQRTLMSSLQNNKRIPGQTSGKGQLLVTSQHSATGMALSSSGKCLRFFLPWKLRRWTASKEGSNIIMGADSRPKTSGQAQRTLSLRTQPAASISTYLGQFSSASRLTEMMWIGPVDVSSTLQCVELGNTHFLQWAEVCSAFVPEGGTVSVFQGCSLYNYPWQFIHKKGQSMPYYEAMRKHKKSVEKRVPTDS